MNGPTMSGPAMGGAAGDRQLKDIASLAAVAVGLLLAALLTIVPLGRHLARQWSVRSQLLARLGEAKALEARTAAARASLEATGARREALERRLGRGQSVAKVLEVLGQEAKSHKLELVATQPKQDADSPRRVRITSDLIAQAVPVTVQISGRYRQLGEFLGILREAPFLASIQQVSITEPNQETGRLRADLELTLYLTDARPSP